MRDDAAGPLPPTVVQQPDPMLDEQPVGWFRVAITTLVAAVVVALVMYGLTRPPAEEPQMAASSGPSETAPAGGGAANGAGGQAPANAAQNPQPNAQQPTTTGQGSGGDKGQTGPSKTPPAAGGSATSAVGPGAKPAPQAR